MYTKAQPGVMENGQVTERFRVERGCQQGGPLSPYLFLLCAEILGMLIHDSSLVKAMCIDSKEFKI